MRPPPHQPLQVSQSRDRRRPTPGGLTAPWQNASPPILQRALANVTHASFLFSLVATAVRTALACPPLSAPVGSAPPHSPAAARSRWYVYDDAVKMMAHRGSFAGALGAEAASSFVVFFVRWPKVVLLVFSRALVSETQCATAFDCFFVRWPTMRLRFARTPHSRGKGAVGRTEAAPCPLDRAHARTRARAHAHDTTASRR